jgi:hypothetical protein
MTKDFTKKNTISQNLGPDLPGPSAVRNQCLLFTRTHSSLRCFVGVAGGDQFTGSPSDLSPPRHTRTYTAGYRKCHCFFQRQEDARQSTGAKNTATNLFPPHSYDSAAHAQKHSCLIVYVQKQAVERGAHPDTKQLQNLNVEGRATISLKKSFF